jgi:Fic family protein
LQQIKDWHKVLMRGLIDNAGEFSTKQRVLPNVDTQLTHPDDIVEELESWVTAYAYIQNLSDIAQAHYHFEMCLFCLYALLWILPVLTILGT